MKSFVRILQIMAANHRLSSAYRQRPISLRGSHLWRPGPRSGQRGSIVIVAMLAMVALISLGGYTALSVRGGLASGGHDHFKSIALYAAESGAAAGIDFLRTRVHSTEFWSDFVIADNSPPASLLSPVEISGNNKRPGEIGNLFDPDLRAWYSVVILNNLDDPGLATGDDQDKRVIVRSTGYGPGDAIARVEVEIRADGAIGNMATGCFAQGGQCARGGGNDSTMGAMQNIAGGGSTTNPSSP